MVNDHPTSLSEAIDTVSEALFLERPISDELRIDTITLLINRQIHTGTNNGFFLPLSSEPDLPYRLFSGEQLHTKLARRHIQLIEATRLLSLLTQGGHSAARSIKLAESRMDTMCYSKFCASGECKAISVAYLRYLASSAPKSAVDRLSFFLASLASHRDGKGAWRGFPYFYTLLTLSEMDRSMSNNELQYALGSFEKRLARSHSAEPFTRRRQLILNRILSWS